MEFFNCINYLLTVSRHEIYQALAVRLEPYGITPAQYSVLSCLWQYGTLTPKQLSQILQLENSTVSGLLDRMQRQGLVHRQPLQRDRRSVQVSAAPAGEALREPVTQVLRELNEEVLRGFTPQQREELLSSLRTLGKLRWLDSAAAPKSAVTQEVKGL